MTMTANAAYRSTMADKVNLVTYLTAQRRPTADALRLVYDGTIPASRPADKPGLWVDPDELEAALAEHGGELRAASDARLRERVRRAVRR